jgi:hypothetical protein
MGIKLFFRTSSFADFWAHHCQVEAAKLGEFKFGSDYQLVARSEKMW